MLYFNLLGLYFFLKLGGESPLCHSVNNESHTHCEHNTVDTNRQ